MANAMEILGDDNVIYAVFLGVNLVIEKDDCKEAVFIKNYINNAVLQAKRHHEEYTQQYRYLYEAYRLKRDKWYKRGMNGEEPIYPRPHDIYTSQNLVRLKVNHYRQKLWYWKKL